MYAKKGRDGAKYFMYRIDGQWMVSDSLPNDGFVKVPLYIPIFLSTTI